MLKKQGIDFNHGGLLGDAPEGRSDADNISHLRSYKPPSETQGDIRSATSRSHDIQNFAENSGVGWGEYDAFASWQAHGRCVDRLDVQGLNWHDPGPVRSVSGAGHEVLELPVRPADKNEAAGEPAMSLWRKMAKGPDRPTDEKKARALEKEKGLPLPRDIGL